MHSYHYEKHTEDEHGAVFFHYFHSSKNIYKKPLCPFTENHASLISCSMSIYFDTRVTLVAMRGRAASPSDLSTSARQLPCLHSYITDLASSHPACLVCDAWQDVLQLYPAHQPFPWLVTYPSISYLAQMLPLALTTCHPLANFQPTHATDLTILPTMPLVLTHVLSTTAYLALACSTTLHLHHVQPWKRRRQKRHRPWATTFHRPRAPVRS